MRYLECPVFHPTLADVNGPFEAYIERLERKMAVSGVCKIVAPEGWQPRQAGYPDNLDLTINRPIRQHATGSRGLFRAIHIEQKPMSLRDDFRPLAMDPDNNCATTSDPHELERKYWKNVTLRPPLYGADVSGSLFDDKPSFKGWNMRRLDTLLSRVLQQEGHNLPGVSSPYLYFGTWRSTFAWHTEDLDLYSVNYLHYGAGKSWYVVPPEHRTRFEGVIKGMLPDMFRPPRGCPEFLRHKELIISPQLLEQYQIPYVKVVQGPREFVINYPGAYHAGFNHGYNCAESVNFATRKWIPVGAVANHCCCSPDSVTINMKLFRHMVPAKLLPPELFESSSDSSSGSDSDDDDDNSDGSSSSGRESSSEDEEATASNKRRRTESGRAAGFSGRDAIATSDRRNASRRVRTSAVGGIGRRMGSSASAAAVGGLGRRMGTPRVGGAGVAKVTAAANTTSGRGRKTGASVAAGSAVSRSGRRTGLSTRTTAAAMAAAATAAAIAPGGTGTVGAAKLACSGVGRRMAVAVRVSRRESGSGGGEEDRSQRSVRRAVKAQTQPDVKAVQGSTAGERPQRRRAAVAAAAISKSVAASGSRRKPIVTAPSKNPGARSGRTAGDTSVTAGGGSRAETAADRRKQAASRALRSVRRTAAGAPTLSSSKTPLSSKALPRAGSGGGASGSNLCSGGGGGDPSGLGSSRLRSSAELLSSKASPRAAGPSRLRSGAALPSGPRLLLPRTCSGPATAQRRAFIAARQSADAPGASARATAAARVPSAAAAEAAHASPATSEDEQMSDGDGQRVSAESPTSSSDAPLAVVAAAERVRLLNATAASELAAPPAPICVPAPTAAPALLPAVAAIPVCLPDDSAVSVCVPATLAALADNAPLVEQPAPPASAGTSPAQAAADASGMVRSAAEMTGTSSRPSDAPAVAAAGPGAASTSSRDALQAGPAVQVPDGHGAAAAVSQVAPQASPAVPSAERQAGQAARHDAQAAAAPHAAGLRHAAPGVAGGAGPGALSAGQVLHHAEQRAVAAPDASNASRAPLGESGARQQDTEVGQVLSGPGGQSTAVSVIATMVQDATTVFSGVEAAPAGRGPGSFVGRAAAADAGARQPLQFPAAAQTSSADMAAGTAAAGVRSSREGPTHGPTLQPSSKVEVPSRGREGGRVKVLTPKAAALNEQLTLKLQAKAMKQRLTPRQKAMQGPPPPLVSSC